MAPGFHASFTHEPRNEVGAELQATLTQTALALGPHWDILQVVAGCASLGLLAVWPPQVLSAPHQLCQTHTGPPQARLFSPSQGYFMDT